MARLAQRTSARGSRQFFFAGGGKTGFLRRLSWSKPAPTLVTHPAMPATDLAHPEEDRPLSVQEYRQIQEFPPPLNLAGSIIDQYRQIGNAVPTSLGKAIGRTLLAHDAGRCEEPEGFPYSRYVGTDEESWEREYLSRTTLGRQECFHSQFFKLAHVNTLSFVNFLRR